MRAKLLPRDKSIIRHPRSVLKLPELEYLMVMIPDELFPSELGATIPDKKTMVEIRSILTDSGRGNGRRKFVQYKPFIHFLASGCWLWKRDIKPNGYSFMTNHSRSTYAHRIFYEKFVGPIPHKYDIDHLCRTRACVNPKHLEAVTHKVNMNRGAGPGGALTPKELKGVSIWKWTKLKKKLQLATP